MSISRNSFLGAVLMAGLAVPVALPVTGAAAQTKDLTVVTSPRPPKPAGTEAPVSVSLVPEGSTTIRIGAPIRFKVVSTHAGFGHLYVASASGKVQLWAENLRLKAGVPVDIPRRGLAIVASAPAGDETIVFVATRDRFKGFLGGSTVTNPADIQVSRDSLMAQLQAKLAATPRPRWGLTQVVVRVTE